MKNFNFVFWGTPDVAKETLEILHQNGYLPSLIITAPDARAGRGMRLHASPVALFAEQNNIPCLKPENLKKGSDIVFKSITQAGEPSIAINQQIDMRGFKNNIRPDFFLVVAYGKIIPEEILNIPKLGSLNIHYSLLPKYRGVSPVESAILNGETETGVAIQKMIYKMDAGDIIAQEKVKILPTETTPELRKRLIKVGGELLVKILPDFLENKITPIAQDETRATHCKKIAKRDGLINLNDEATKNYNKFRAYAHWPRTFFFKDGKRIIITDAILENNPRDPALGKQFIIKKIIPEGGREIEYKA